jgi:hypothetical protein
MIIETELVKMQRRAPPLFLNS